MGWKEEYKSKLRTPEEAVKVIRSGDRIYTGTSSSIAYRLIEALYGRKDELEDVVMCHGMMGQQLPIFTPEAKGHFCAVLLVPGYGVGAAFAASLLRNLLGLGSPMAFPGSMLGALLCGLAYWKTENIPLTLLAEVFGTAVLGGLCAYPVAVLVMGKDAGSIAFYAYIIPFFVSTAGGAVLSGAVGGVLSRFGVLKIWTKEG